MRLSSLGYWEHPVIEPALKWLKLHWEDWELVARTWYGSWSLLCLYQDNIELNESLYRRCYEYARDWLPQLKSQPLTWLLDALQGAGVSVNEPLVIGGIARLESLQNEEGVWPDPQYSTVETTVTVLRLLRDYGSVPVREGEG